MKKVDSLLKNFHSKLGNNTNIRNNSQGIIGNSKTPSKSKDKETISKIVNKNDKGDKTDKGDKGDKTDKAIKRMKDDKLLTNANLKLITGINRTTRTPSKNFEDSQRMTRSASKNEDKTGDKNLNSFTSSKIEKLESVRKTDTKSKSITKKFQSSNERNLKLRSKTLETDKKIENIIKTNDRDKQKTNNMKTNFLPKSSFLLKKKLQFKQEAVRADKPITSLSKSTERNIKNKYDFVQSKVKKIISEADKITSSEINNIKTYSKSDRPLKKTSDKNFVRMNLKRGYVEKKHLKKFKNVKKTKSDKSKQFYRYQNKLIQNTDTKYLGRGNLGLDDEIDCGLEPNEEVLSFKGSRNNSQKKNKVETIIGSSLDGIQEKVPCFSEGYYNNINNITEETNEIITELEVDKMENTQNQKIDINDTSNKNDLNNINNRSNIKAPKSGLTPNRILLTNKLTTALKSSLKKNVTLDTELRILSKEFRYLLSGRHKEIQDLNKNLEIGLPASVEKKLNFNDGFKCSHSKLVVEEDDSDSNDQLTEEEVIKLENDILIKVLEENFGFLEFLPGQLETIKYLLNNKTTLAVLPPGGGKSLCYQLPALVSEGLTIVVSPLLALIVDQITNLPECLSGASLSSFTNYRQRSEIFDAIKSKKIKILFVTPERFAMENFSEIDQISFICFDEASCVCPLSPSYRSAYASIPNVIERLKPNGLLFLANNMTNFLQENIIQQYKIDKIVKENIVLPRNMKIFVSKEENKLQALVKLLRNHQYKNIPCLIFCTFKRNVDKVASYLNQSGLSASSYHSGKSEMDRQIIQSNFMKDKIKIIVCTSGFSMGISKPDIRLVILFDMPSQIESFLQQIGRGGRDKKETHAYVLLNDDDYFAQRNYIYLDNIEKSQIMKYLDYMVNILNSNSNLKPHKRNYAEAIENKPVFNSDMPLPKTICLNFLNMFEYSGIKKQTQLYLILSLLNEKITENIISDFKFKCLGIGPSFISLKFYKTRPELLAENESNIKLILECAREYQGSYRFSTLEACEKIGITHNDLINYLYNLQSRGEVGYECKEDGLFITIEKIPDSFKEIIKYMNEKMQFFINLNITKLNASYVLMRKFAINSIDNLLNISGNNLGKSAPIKCLTIYSDYSDYEKEFKQFFENYFTVDDVTADIYISGNLSELAIILPVLVVDSQREKSAIVKDIEDMVKKEVEKNCNISIIEIVNVLFGIYGTDGKNNYFSNPLWGKFQQNDYKFIYEIVENSTIKSKSELITKGFTNKKLKI